MTMVSCVVESQLVCPLQKDRLGCEYFSLIAFEFLQIMQKCIIGLTGACVSSKIQ